MSDLLRVYLDPGEINDLTGYPHAWEKPLEKLLEVGRELAEQLSPGSTAAAIAFLDDGTLAIKDYIRARDGHRCLRCGHPYLPGIAKEHPRGEWTPCDAHCDHGEPIRLVDLDGILEPFVEAQWRILTVHHLNGIKHDCRWWNLVSLCQRCHLTVQGKVYMDRPWNKPHSEWFKPFAAGFYAWKYLDLELDQEETLARLDELLDLELTQDALF